MLITWKETAVWTDYTHYICTFRLNGRNVSLQQTANDHIRCWVTKQQQQPLGALNCSMLTHFSLMNKTIQGTIYCDFFPFFGDERVSTESSRLKMPQRSSGKSPRTCEFTHFFCPFFSSFVQRHHHVCTVVWLRAPQGFAEGRECVYYNTFMPYTMFSLWSWLSPVGPSRSQPLLSLNLWGLINQTR